MQRKKLSLEEVNQLGIDFYELKNKALMSSENKQALKELEKFKIFLTLEVEFILNGKLSPYKNYPNFPDLKQEAYVSLYNALVTFDPNKGGFASWLHNYLIKVPRAASNYKLVRSPIKKAKDLNFKTLPFDELKETSDNYDLILESKTNAKNILNKFFSLLNSEEKSFIQKKFGMHEQGQLTVEELCQEYKMTPYECYKKVKKLIKNFKESVDISI